MNATDQAKNGFKTFIITLAISLFLFSIIYYVATDISQPVSIESTDELDKPISRNTDNKDTVKDEDSFLASAETAGTASVFEDLANQKLDVPQKTVLGGADTRESTQSTVPATGVLGVTYAFTLSISAIAFGTYFLVIEPRRRALARFERRVTNDLN